MEDLPRKGAKNLISKVLLAVLLLAMVVGLALFNISDVVRGFGATSVAKVGKTEIGIEEFQQAYQDELAQFSQQIGRRLTPEQSKGLGLEGRALSRLIGAAAIDAHVRDLRLGLNERAIADQVFIEPAFKGPDGKFSKDLFFNYLRTNNLSEPRFLATQRREQLRDQITESMFGDTAAPAALVDIFHRWREETRKISFITLDPAKSVTVPTPDDAKLQAYYEANKRRFVTPEQRKLAVLLMTRDDVKKKVIVSDDDVKATYEIEKDRFDVPEKRRIAQLAFPDRAAADKAYGDLSKVKSFADAATKAGFKETDIDLGLVTRKELIDGKIAAAAFALKKDELSQPVQGDFSVVLLRVSEIQPGKQRTFDEVKAELTDRIATERATREIQTIHDDVENSRASGKTLKETAEKFGLTFREIASTDNTGKALDGKPALDNPDVAKIVRAAFGGATGVEADAIDLADGGYAWFDVLGTTPEAQKPFDTVKTEVQTAWSTAERRTALATLATSVATRLTKGEAFDAIAKELALKSETTAAITRSTSPQGLTANAVQRAFTLAKGTAGATASANGESQIIFQAADIMPAPEATKAQTDRLKAELTQQMQGDLLAGYINGLQGRYGVVINEPVVKQVLGQGTQR